MSGAAGAGVRPGPAEDRAWPLEFGVVLGSEAARADELVGLARRADDLGLDLLGLMDHPYAGANLDAWTLLSVIAARTDRIRLFLDVANLPLRPPAMLAKAAASLDLLSGGRVECGLGAGALADKGGGGMGGPVRTPGQAVAALGEAIEVIRRMWQPGRGPVTYRGDHYRLDSVVPGPQPAHPIGIWVGALQPRMIELTARQADGWLPSYPYIEPAGLAALNQRMDHAARSAGRSPGAIRRLYNIMGAIVPNGSTMFNEDSGAWIERLTELVIDGGITGVQFAPATDPARQIETFAQEVVPAVREEVVTHLRPTGMDHSGAAGPTR